jgi:hypothetical protein
MHRTAWRRCFPGLEAIFCGQAAAATHYALRNRGYLIKFNASQQWHLFAALPTHRITMQPTWFFSSLLALSVGFPLLAQAAETPALHAVFARPQQLVDIGGRTLNLYCSGAGATTVLFDAPSGEGGWSWFKVQPEVARHTRACVYDRAGLGFSDAAARPNTSANAVEDVHKALTAAGIKPPYLLVGNSLGGENAQVFTYRYPAEVKGLVLVEPQTEDQTARMDNITGGKITQFYAMVKRQDAWIQAEQPAAVAQAVLEVPAQIR